MKQWIAREVRGFISTILGSTNIQNNESQRIRIFGFGTYLTMFYLGLCIYRSLGSLNSSIKVPALVALRPATVTPHFLHVNGIELVIGDSKTVQRVSYFLSSISSHV